MRRGVQQFFDHWVQNRLPHLMSVGPVVPGPLAMLARLYADAAEEGICEVELRDLFVDPFEALIRVMMDAAPSLPASEQVDNAPAAHARATPAAAMRLAISYLDGFREVVKGDVELAADLVLFNLAQQGFHLTAWSGEETGPAPMDRILKVDAVSVSMPADLLKGRML